MLSPDALKLMTLLVRTTPSDEWKQLRPGERDNGIYGMSVASHDENKWIAASVCAKHDPDIGGWLSATTLIIVPEPAGRTLALIESPLHSERLRNSADDDRH